MFFVFFYLSIGETEQRTFAAEDGTSRLDELAPGAGRLSVDGQRPTESRRPARRRAQPDGLRLHGVLGLHHQVKKKGAPWFPLSIGVVCVISIIRPFWFRHTQWRVGVQLLRQHGPVSLLLRAARRPTHRPLARPQQIQVRT